MTSFRPRIILNAGMLHIQERVRKTAEKNTIKPDVILKSFWRDNGRFADLFNGALFGGNKVIDPAALHDADTDVSSILKFNSHAETLARLLDVIKKHAYGIDFVILGLEGQMSIHYAMPLRHMISDALSYYKEYTELSKKNRAAKNLSGADEFLSGLRKEDRLHPTVTLCVYYGEDAWDGPLCLLDMLHLESVPEPLKAMVCDYKMNFIQVSESDAFQFTHPDVQAFFDITRNIYLKNYEKIKDIYGNLEISSELGLVIGAVTHSKELIDKALERKGGSINMCRALEDLKNEGKIEGKIEGILTMCKDFGATIESAAEKLQAECGFNAKDALSYAKKYYMQ